jgi:type IV pilus assembly protein PilF
MTLRWPALAVCAVFVVLVSGCQTPGGFNAGGDSQEAPRDRVTTSDESPGSKRARVRLELASAYFTRGQLATALDEVKQALVSDPNLPEAYNLRGLIYAGMGEFQFAEESYRRALQINPRDGDTMHNLAWFLCQQRRYTDSDTLFAQAIEQPQYTGGTRTLLARGVCLARAGRMAEAEASLVRAYELDAANPATAVNLSEVLLRRGDHERARFYIRRVNLQPEQVNAQTLWLAARIEIKLGNRQGANEFGKQMRERFPQAPETAAFDRGQFDD